MVDRTFGDEESAGRASAPPDSDHYDLRQATHKSGYRESTINDVAEQSTLPSAEKYGATFADAPEQPTKTAEWSKSGRPDGYQFVRLIGEGGMGSVALARDSRLGRWVALKRVLADRVGDRLLTERFKIEAQALAALDHQGIVRIYTFGEDLDGPFLVMEYVAGPASNRPEGWPVELPSPPLSLEQAVKDSGPLDVAQAVALMIKLCEATGCAHAGKVVHRDIKPANILLADGGDPKLVDFGLARPQERDGDGPTQYGAKLLTIGYGAPEQEVDAASADHRADIYSLGATLWYVLTGDNPRYFREGELPDSLRPIVSKALSKNREQRYQNIAEFCDALQSLDVAATDSKSGSVYAIKPGSAEGLKPGRCPECGHQQAVEAGGSLRNRFCDQCGSSLVDPCLACGKVNERWGKFCGGCGGDLQKLVSAAEESLQVQARAVEQSLAGCEFETALQHLYQIEQFKHQEHSVLKPLVDRATQRRAEITRQQNEARDSLERLAVDGELHFKAGNFAEVVRLLQQIPEKRRHKTIQQRLREAESKAGHIAELKAKIRKRADDLKQLTADDFAALRADIARLLELQPKNEEIPQFLPAIQQAEIRVLRRVIRKAIEEKSLVGLESKVEQLVELSPDDASARQLLERLTARRQTQLQADQQTWDNAIAANTPDAIEAYLRHFPHGERADFARRKVAQMYRESVIFAPRDRELRKMYLSRRDEASRLADLRRAYWGMAIIYGLRVAIVIGAVWCAFGWATGSLTSPAITFLGFLLTPIFSLAPLFFPLLGLAIAGAALINVRGWLGAKNDSALAADVDSSAEPVYQAVLVEPAESPRFNRSEQIARLKNLAKLGPLPLGQYVRPVSLLEAEYSPFGQPVESAASRTGAWWLGIPFVVWCVVSCLAFAFFLARLSQP